MAVYVHNEDDQVHHSCRDTLGRALAAGRRYYLSQPGKATRMVTLVEDESTCDLYLKVQGSDGTERMQRVDECAVDCTFSLQLSAEPIDEVLQAAVADCLARAASARQELAIAEQSLCNMLGCEVGDMTGISDAITSAVRDGLGTAIDLVQISFDQ